MSIKELVLRNKSVLLGIPGLIQPRAIHPRGLGKIYTPYISYIVSYFIEHFKPTSYITVNWGVLF